MLNPFKGYLMIWVRIHLMACRDICCEETSLFKYLKFFSQNAEPLRPLPFRPKSGVYLIFYNICPYTPFKGKWGSGSPTPLSKADGGQEIQGLMACMSISCEETSPFKYLKFFSQNAEPLRPLPFRPKSGVYLIFYNILPLHPFQRQMRVRTSISWHVETFVVRKLAHLNIWSFSAKMLNHSGLLQFRPKSGVYLIFYNICPYTRFQRQMRVDVHLMACRDCLLWGN